MTVAVAFLVVATFVSFAVLSAVLFTVVAVRDDVAGIVDQLDQLDQLDQRPDRLDFSDEEMTR